MLQISTSEFDLRGLFQVSTARSLREQLCPVNNASHEDCRLPAAVFSRFANQAAPQSSAVEATVPETVSY